MKNAGITKKWPFMLVLLMVFFSSTCLLSQKPELFSKVGADDINAVKALISAGADVNQEDDMMGYTPLSLAKSVEMLKVLILAGADINHKDKRTGYTPLMMALNSNDIEVAKFFIAEGADIKMKSNDGSSALILACGCSEEIAKDLLEKGADIHAITEKGNGVFTQCTNVGLKRETVSYAFAEFLLSKGADIDEANTTSYYGGYTPLFWAVSDADEKLVGFLVEHGANVNAQSVKGQTPLSIAREAGSDGVVKILEAAGAK